MVTDTQIMQGLELEPHYFELAQQYLCQCEMVSLSESIKWILWSLLITKR